MPDLRTLLHEAADAVPVPPAGAAVDGDLARGRRALAHDRRIRWAVVPTGLGAAATAGVMIAGPSFMPSSRTAVAVDPSAPASASGPISPGGARGATNAPGSDLSARISLVAYTGEQPAGYTVDKVPDDWEVQGVDEYSLVIAPVSAKDKDPNSFRGKIHIGKANEGEVKVERPGGVKPLKVGDVTAQFFTFPDPEPGPGARVDPADTGTLGLLLPVGKGDYLIFQIPGTLNWDAPTVAAFAAGVHMHANAKAAAG